MAITINLSAYKHKKGLYQSGYSPLYFIEILFIRRRKVQLIAL